MHLLFISVIDDMDDLVLKGLRASTEDIKKKIINSSADAETVVPSPTSRSGVPIFRHKIHIHL